MSDDDETERLRRNLAEARRALAEARAGGRRRVPALSEWNVWSKLRSWAGDAAFHCEKMEEEIEDGEWDEAACSRLRLGIAGAWIAMAVAELAREWKR